MSQSDAKIALLIDADNAPAAKIDLILSELAKYGMVNIRRAYGNWKSTSLQSWENVLHEYAIRPIQQFDYTKGKNATDMALVIEAMDLLYTQKLDAFCVVSSDCDFTPLVMRILTSGHRVYGFGEKKTPLPFVRACSKFTYLEALGTPEDVGEVEVKTAAPPPTLITSDTASTATATIKKTTNELKGDTQLILLLRNAVDATAGDDGWAGLGAVGQHISNQASFDSRNYGFKKLSDLFVACGLFEIARRNGHVYVKDKKTSKKPQPEGKATGYHPPSHSVEITNNPLKIHYKNLLAKKNWITLSENKLLAFLTTLRGIPPSSSKELISACSLSLSNILTPTETETAFNIFWKAKLFEVASPDGQTGLKKVLIFQDSPHVLHKIDTALLTRLLVACVETGTPIDTQEIKPLLYGYYNQNMLADVIKNLSDELTLKD
jgi:uncharacterized LabA/DUF88 family protein